MKSDHSHTLRALVDEATAAKPDLAPEKIDQVLGRVRRQLADAEAPSRPVLWRRPVLAFATLVVVAGAALWYAKNRAAVDPPTPLAAATPPVRVQKIEGSYRLGQTPTALATLATLSNESVLELAAGSHAQLDVEKTASVALVGPAELTNGRIVRLMSGRASFSVKRQPPGSEFAVLAGDTTVVVHGTRFALAVDHGQLMGLRVTEGLVELRGPRFSGGVQVPAGEQWGEPLTEIEPIIEAPAGPSTGGIDLATSPSGASLSIDGLAYGQAPLWLRVERGQHEVEAKLAGYLVARAQVTVEADRVEISRLILEKAAPIAVEPPSQSPTLPEPTAPAARVPPDFLQLAERALRLGKCAEIDHLVAIERKRNPGGYDRIATLQAECALRGGQPRVALEVYKGIAANGAGGAEAAQFEVGKLLADLDDHDGALRALDLYLARYKRGRFESEAAFRRCEAFIALTLPADARFCLEAFLAAKPEAPRRQEALFDLATIERTDHRWAEAAKHYEAYLKNAQGPRAEEALFQLARCRKNGSLSGVSDAIDEALRRFPHGAHVDELEKLRQ